MIITEGRFTMLNNEDNELLCRVGKGTPMGNLLRRFWLPALLTSEIETPDGPPKRIRVMGEDLLVFRDSKGAVGIIDAYCPHKLAPLFFGRNEECGIRCAYNGWKFDVQGNCVDIPNLPSTANAPALRQRAKLTSYPARESGGLVWIYMGPTELEPPLPGLEWLGVPPSHVQVARWIQRSNWAQGMEGEIDTSHVSFLHRSLAAPLSPTLPSAMNDGAPVITLKETDYGFVYGARRQTETPGQYYWRVTQWFMPMFSMIPNDPGDLYPRGGRAWVPVDDEHVMIFTYSYRHGSPLAEEHRAIFAAGTGFPPPLERGAYQLPDGHVIDTFLPLATRENDYRIDRERQKTLTFAGVLAITDQDRSLQENMRSVPGSGPGKMVDRSREMLVPSDLPVITARRMLLKAAKDLARGVEPALARKPDSYKQRSVAAMSTEADFESLLQNPEVLQRMH